MGHRAMLIEVTGVTHAAATRACLCFCVQVSVAKAGLVASLPARTSVLAAANPVNGHYDKSKTVSENLKMSPAMLSRWVGWLGVGQEPVGWLAREVRQ